MCAKHRNFADCANVTLIKFAAISYQMKEIIDVSSNSIWQMRPTYAISYKWFEYYTYHIFILQLTNVYGKVKFSQAKSIETEFHSCASLLNCIDFGVYYVLIYKKIQYITNCV